MRKARKEIRMKSKEIKKLDTIICKVEALQSDVILDRQDAEAIQNAKKLLTQVYVSNVRQ